MNCIPFHSAFVLKEVARSGATNCQCSGHAYGARSADSPFMILTRMHRRSETNIVSGLRHVERGFLQPATLQ